MFWNKNIFEQAIKVVEEENLKKNKKIIKRNEEIIEIAEKIFEDSPKKIIKSRFRKRVLSLKRK